MKKCISILFICSLIIFPAHIILADTDGTTEVSIEITPLGDLFNITNMKPGDWAPRTVTIKNNGLQAFDYQVSVINDGSDNFFNELILEVNDQQNELYKGRLAAFESISSRNLAPAKSEELELTIRFPDGSGNEFQGLDAQFSFVFTAEAQTNKNAVSSTYIKGIVGSDGMMKSGIFGLSPSTVNTLKFFLITGLTIIIGGGLFQLNRKMNR